MIPARVSREQWLRCLMHSDLSPALRAVVLAVAVHMTRRGEGAFPSKRRVAMLTGRSHGYAGKLLRRLIADGWLSAGDRKPRKRVGRPSKLYAATVPPAFSEPLVRPEDALDFGSSLKDPKETGVFGSLNGEFGSSMKDPDLSLTEIEERSVRVQLATESGSAVEAGVFKKVLRERGLNPGNGSNFHGGSKLQ